MDEDLRFLLKKSVTPTDDLVYEPSVDSPYETLTHYLDGHEINMNYFQANDVQEAFAQFMLRHETNKGNSVFLVGKENLEKLSRSKRDTSGADPAPSTNNTVLVGLTCAAYMESIRIVDNTLSLSKEPVDLPINSASSSFNCDQNNAA